MKYPTLLLWLVLFSSPGLLHAQIESDSQPTAETPPIRALLIAGGCCHDYANQQKALCEGIQKRANVRVDVYWTDNSTTAPVLPLYRKLDWADQYDVIIHDECAADIKDKTLVNRIVQVHQDLPAVHLHCAMHSFRTGTDAWFKHLGLQSSGHGPQRPIDIEFSEHPITATLKNWTTINEELYNNVKVFGAQSLAIGKQELGGRNPRTEEAIVAWVNESAGARSFSTTIGHNTETIEDDRYLELVTRGLLWACDKLNEDYLRPYEGDHSVTFIDKNSIGQRRDKGLGKKPEGALLALVEATSFQTENPPFHAIDGDTETRWCAAHGGYPQSLTMRLEKAVDLQSVEVTWEFDRPYRYRVETSTDGQNWQTYLERSDRESGENSAVVEASKKVAWLRVVGVSAPRGSWCSIREIKVIADGVNGLWPAEEADGKLAPVQANQYKERGNIPPRIQRLTAQEEAEILRDVTVPEGFKATVFAAPPAVNYPVFVAATVDGTVFVSSDGNGSLGRNPERGRIIRLRDTDGDGRADETNVFCEVDAPRGLVWDHDRLFVMHPPHLSAFIDLDHDGVADIQKILVRDLAFGYEDRPADHTTNGLSLGVDGWLYIAGGDFGVLDAEDASGKHLTHRGGGVLRVRPDGTGLEVYSTGTRNILEVAISPQMEMFARDNTNDGGGWDVRLHHFTGGEDHGYPRLYKNFNDEIVQPLADYGGGSGCGAVYIDEPGFGRWNNAPFTADWGTGSLYRHTVNPEGATYQETAAPESFIKLTRPTDADVDGNSRVYCASWRGATFDWAGPNVGYIVCVQPEGYEPETMPDFENAADQELIQLLESPSYRRRVEAQRTLMRRGNAAYQTLLNKGLAQRNSQRTLLEELQAGSTQQCLKSLSHADPVVVHTAIRTLAKRQAYSECFAALDQGNAPVEEVLRALAMMHQTQVVEGLVERLNASPGEGGSSDMQLPILSTLSRLYYQEGKWTGDSWGTRPDTRGPYYQPEAWEGTTRIDQVLRQWLAKAEPSEQAELIPIMQKNRVPLNDALRQLVKLAATNTDLIPETLSQLVEVSELPDGALEVLAKAVEGDFPSGVYRNVIRCLVKSEAAQSAPLLLAAMSRMDQATGGKVPQGVVNAFANAQVWNNQTSTLITVDEPVMRLWADVALLTLISGTGSPEAREMATIAVEADWEAATRRIGLMQAAVRVNSHVLDEAIWEIRDASEADVATAAQQAIAALKIQPSEEDMTPKIKTMEAAEALAAIVKQQGNVNLGRRIFVKANCTSCHSLSREEKQKGPFLGNIAQTYKRPELAASVLEPSKTIAQGFATNLFLTIDGELLTGFVTDEQSDRVTIRDQDGKETTLMKEDIEQRKTSETSVMPVGLLDEFTVQEAASLLDFLEEIAKE